jgi:DtxR family Mn-dependent transcriptional regulator
VLATPARRGLTHERPGGNPGMVRKLTDVGIVEHQPYHGVRLTNGRRRVAVEVLRHHRLLELFLAQERGMS